MRDPALTPGGACRTLRPVPGSARSFDPARFREVIGHFTTGVAVITTRHEDRDHGMTASAVCSVSLEPPTLLVCANLRAPTQAAILAAGAFAVNILGEGHDAIAQRFARPHPDKFDGLAHRRGALGVPLLDEALARIECEVTESVVGGTHRVFLGAVRDAQVEGGTPLAYYRGRFGRLELAADEHALERLRRAVLVREHPLDEPLAAAALAERLDVDEASVHYALTRLVAEGLVERTTGGYMQVPLDARMSDEALEAKLAIDLSAARMAVERASDEALAKLVESAEAIPAPPADPDDPHRIEAHVQATERFHEQMIELSCNAPLLRAYRQLSLPGISLRVLATDDAGSDRLTADHVEIAHTLRRRDWASLQSLLTEHSRRGRTAHRRAIEHAGGRV
jgi:flavin reductase (DIM6/NTAB) family NADH-FMN oxidoreductase RutF/DNA-binding Lrp family transcriptional regulator